MVTVFVIALAAILAAFVWSAITSHETDRISATTKRLAALSVNVSGRLPMSFHETFRAVPMPAYVPPPSPTC